MFSYFVAAIVQTTICIQFIEYKGNYLPFVYMRMTYLAFLVIRNKN